MPANSLTITDNRTGKAYELPIANGAIRAMDLRQIRTGPEDFGLLSYDPAFTNTASTISRITEIDGDRGILRYRGYPIEELAERSNYLEVAYLVLHGELPTLAEMDRWIYDITHHTWVHENLKKLMEGFHYDAHAMGMLVSGVAALSTFYPEAKNGADPETRRLQVVRLLAKMPTLAAFAYRHSLGLPYNYPDNELSYTGNFLNMLFRATEPKYHPNATLERALEVLFILHADHEQNCSTNAVPAFIKGVKEGKAKLMGFGHRVYKNYDPRAKIIKRMADEVFEVTRPSPLLPVALELERIALEDEYFVSRKLYPNVDFYSGLIYQAMGFPVEMFPVLFAIARTSGWLAQWQEMRSDPEQKIARPRQLYLGSGKRAFVEMGKREEARGRRA